MAAIDRAHLVELFEQTKGNNQSTIEMIPIWKAVNHKGELLITALIHNRTEQLLEFIDTTIIYEEVDNHAEFSFTLPELKVEPFTSQPWTFIFPEHQEKNATRSIIKAGKLYRKNE